MFFFLRYTVPLPVGQQCKIFRMVPGKTFTQFQMGKTVTVGLQKCLYPQTVT